MDESIVLCHHWGGANFPEEVVEYLKEFKMLHTGKDRVSTPFSRMEPAYLILQIAAHFCNASLYSGRSTEEVDNGDYGHYRISVPSLKVEQVQ